MRTGCGLVLTIGIEIPALGHDHSIIDGSGSLVCRRDACDHQYEIGDTGPAGGIIFYVADGQEGRTPITVEASPAGTPDGRDWLKYTAHYLEVAPTSEGNARWGDGFVSGVTTFETLPAPEGSLIGNGRKDTWLIVNHLGPDVTGMAAQLCVNRTTGANDWFLPSRGELTQLFRNRAAVNAAGGDLEDTYCWSSSQVHAFSAWQMNVSAGTTSSSSKSTDNIVRAVRAF
jgi:hypothetical protein